ncbi:amino acid ABC transporter substrate-binding protein [Alicyclobacillus sp. ALC3]|uniref:amino acid ABC transporter substrate-binding protein n=1 Tax=Alicyclobacillus sp. ALC3 TaxID=2796143 RepID=UPI002379D9E9|nr:amino acid ABC transporter substrate-binding protein [Alicyclobacillus sp. ALC3]WDL97577.1 amino acid ABC transporter substrate-binding protein [Alicyclobacillus sp. ALC3]
MSRLSVQWRKLGKKSRMSMAVAAVATGMLVTACGNSAGGGGGTGNATGSASKAPIKIGISVSLSGDFSGDGQSIEAGYKLWANYVNRHGGLLGRQVKLIFLNDASSTTQVVTNYQTLINVDHVNLVFGPFSSLLTTPAATIANRYGYAFPEPAGGGPAVFQAKLPNLVFVQPAPVVDNLVSFAHWILSLPPSERPKTAAYATENDPFTQPQLQVAQQILQKGGVKTVYFRVYPAETTDYSPIADGVINSKAQVVLLGTQLPDAIAFVQQFEQQHYSPKALVETAGPDQGSQFSKAVGLKNTQGIMVPAGWWYGAKTDGNQTFIQDYLKTYGGTAGGINSDAAEAWSVGQVVQQAVEHTHSINNKTLIQALHSMTFDTIQGPLKFNSVGEPNGQSFLVQWQNGTAVPVYPSSIATASPLYPKPKWFS